MNYQISFLKEPDKVLVNGIWCDVIEETKNDYYINYHDRRQIVNKKTVNITKSLQNMIDKAIERLKCFEPEEGYHLAFSGGKDSIVIYKLAELAKVKFEAIHNHTTVDPPELIYFIRDYYTDIKINYPEKSMWKLIEKKLMPPTRMVRYCCSELKENSGKGRFVITGVRCEESSKRKNTRSAVELNAFSKNMNIFNDNNEARRVVENCQIKSKHIINPIIDWTSNNIWSFIKYYNLPYIDMYDEGYDRLGCIGCPLAKVSQREKEFERYPKYKINYIKAFEKMIQERKRRGKEVQWENGQEVFDWFMYGQEKSNVKKEINTNQISMI